MIDLPPPPIEQRLEAPRTEEAALYFIEKLGGDHILDLEISSLDGGLTASTFLVKAGGRKYVLKILSPHLGLAEMMREMWLSTVAGEKGAGPKILDADIRMRALLMEFVPGEHFASLNPQDSAMADALQKLKGMQQPFSTKPFGTIRERIQKARENHIPLSETMEEALKEVEALELLLQEKGKSPVLCHGDFHIKNILVKDGSAALIDWEASGWGHPYYDVAKLTFSMEFSDSLKLFNLYLGRAASENEEAEFFSLRALVQMCVATNRLLKSKEFPEEGEFAERAAAQFLKLIRSEKKVNNRCFFSGGSMCRAQFR